MQNIDFGRNKKERQKNSPSTIIDYRFRYGNKPSVAKEKSSANNKLVIILSIVIVSFTVGMVSGMHLSKKRNITGLEESNATFMNIESGAKNSQRSEIIADDSISSTENTEKIEEKKTEVINHSDSDSYIILGKIYRSKKPAYKNGLVLKKQGLPVFLAESGENLKLYIGPFKGKRQSYQMLAKVKAYKEFKGAILYKR